MFFSPEMIQRIIEHFEFLDKIFILPGASWAFQRTIEFLQNLL